MTNHEFYRRPLAWLTSLLLTAAALPAATCEQLKQWQREKQAVTLIDIRSSTEFQRGHIPEAINIPAALLPAKKLPALGKVVVYDSGLGREAVDQAAAELNRRPGFQAEALIGGLAAWETVLGATTRKNGLHEQTLAYLTYQQLKAAPPAGLILVDLRQGALPGQLMGPRQLTDLRQEFPRLKVAPWTSNSVPDRALFGAAKNEAPPALVLIDDGDGRAETLARTLRAGGNYRVVILAGGETILARHGEAGLQRLGPGLGGNLPAIPKEGQP